METCLSAELLCRVTHFRTAQQHIEGPAHPATLSRKQVVHHDLLLRSHSRKLKRSETVAHQTQIAVRRRLCKAQTHSTDQAGAKQSKMHYDLLSAGTIMSDCDARRRLRRRVYALPAIFANHHRNPTNRNRQSLKNSG